MIEKSGHCYFFMVGVQLVNINSVRSQMPFINLSSRWVIHVFNSHTPVYLKYVIVSDVKKHFDVVISILVKGELRLPVPNQWVIWL